MKEAGDVTRIIVIPCYNEAERLKPERFHEFDDGGRTRFLFVNDGSTDSTLDVLRELARADEERFALLHLPHNCGKAEAVRRGLLHALTDDPDVVGYWDADLATPLNAIPQLCGLLETRKELEMVLGARVKLMGRRIERRAHRHYLGRVFATFASLVLRLPIYDTQCGAKVLRASPRLRRVLEEPFRATWTFDVELLARFLRFSAEEGVLDPGRAIYEYPLHEWYDAPGSKVRPADYLRAVRELATIWHAYDLPAAKRLAAGSSVGDAGRSGTPK